MGVSINYSNNAFPNNNLETLNVSYFDNYSFTDPNLPSIPTEIFGQDVTNKTKGLLTATWTKILDNSNKWSKNYTFYDDKARAIYVYEKNHLGGYTYIKTELDYRGKIIKTETNHKRINSSTNLKIVDNFEYDHAERTTKHFQKINSQPNQLIAKNRYNELGQLEQKNVGGTNISNTATGLQVFDYKYNIRGWLTEINDVDNLGLSDLFAYKIRYDENHEGSAVPHDVYNGNISQVIWKSAQNNTKKGYAYHYDKLSRLKASYYRYGNSLTSGAGTFETYGLKYDTNGNISR